MTKSGRLRLKLLDVYGRPITHPIEIFLYHQGPRHDLAVSHAVPSASGTVVIGELYSAPWGLYRVEVRPWNYLPAVITSRVFGENPTDVTMAFPVDPTQVKAVMFPAYAKLPPLLQRIMNNSKIGQEHGDMLYRSLTDIPRAALLNIAAKAQFTPTGDEETICHHLARIVEIRIDRIFAIVTAELRVKMKELAAAGKVGQANSSLHNPPKGFEGFRRDGSFKTKDHYGNLQVTFFRKEKTYLADIDIDDANGLAHLFQVLRNTLSNRPTHPYDIHEILLQHQGIDPLYSFQL